MNKNRSSRSIEQTQRKDSGEWGVGIDQPMNLYTYEHMDTDNRGVQAWGGGQDGLGEVNEGRKGNM